MISSMKFEGDLSVEFGSVVMVRRWGVGVGNGLSASLAVSLSGARAEFRCRPPKSGGNWLGGRRAAGLHFAAFFVAEVAQTSDSTGRHTRTLASSATVILYAFGRNSDQLPGADFPRAAGCQNIAPPDFAHPGRLATSSGARTSMIRSPIRRRPLGRRIFARGSSTVRRPSRVAPVGRGRRRGSSRRYGNIRDGSLEGCPTSYASTRTLKPP